MLERVASLVRCWMPSVHIQMLSFSAVDGCYLMRGEEAKIDSSTGCLWARPRNGTWYSFSFFFFFSDAAVTSGECS